MNAYKLLQENLKELENCIYNDVISHNKFSSNKPMIYYDYGLTDDIHKLAIHCHEYLDDYTEELFLNRNRVTDYTFLLVSYSDIAKIDSFQSLDKRLLNHFINQFERSFFFDDYMIGNLRNSLVSRVWKHYNK